MFMKRNRLKRYKGKVHPLDEEEIDERINK